MFGTVQNLVIMALCIVLLGLKGFAFI